MLIAIATGPFHMVSGEPTWSMSLDSLSRTYPNCGMKIRAR